MLQLVRIVAQQIKWPMKPDQPSAGRAFCYALDDLAKQVLIKGEGAAPQKTAPPESV
jgi:hypothetical protein